MPGSTWEKLKALARLKELAAVQPQTVKSGACQDVVLTGDQIDLDALPILQCWPLDGGRYITLPLVFTRHPRTGRRNVGMYRLQVYDKRTTGMHWHLHKDAAEHYRASEGRMEVAVAIGTDPALTYAATAPLPAMIDEMTFAGFLRGKAVELVQCRTVDLRGARLTPSSCSRATWIWRSLAWRGRSAITPATTLWPTSIRCFI